MIKVAFFEDSNSYANILQDLFDKHSDRFEAKHFPNYEALEDNINAFKPKVVLLDILIGKDHEAGIKAVEKIKAKFPRIKIIMITVDPGLSKIQAAFQKGADGYIYKEDIKKSLDFIEDVVKGDIAVTQAVLSSIIESISAVKDTANNYNLTPTEKRIIWLSACDKNVLDIVRILGKDNTTIGGIEGQIRSIKVKLDCKTIQGVVGKALINKLIDLSDLDEFR